MGEQGGHLSMKDRGDNGDRCLKHEGANMRVQTWGFKGLYKVQRLRYVRTRPRSQATGTHLQRVHTHLWVEHLHLDVSRVNDVQDSVNGQGSLRNVG